jgi:pyruvate/2-oxoglutarate dehydrogenase complex dihydrolipoamide dehydrogenase (E3) component
VTYQQGEESLEDVFDTVLFAIGRSADTQGLNLKGVGVKTSKSGKIICNDDDTTDAKDIYAIGDVADGRL